MNIQEIEKIIKNKNKSLYNTFNIKPLSVSKCLTYVKPEFDQQAKAESCSQKGFNDPNSQYYQKTPDDIIKMWTDKSDTSKHYGSLLDDYIGMILNKLDKELAIWKLDHGFDYDDRLQNICKGFDQFYTLLSSNTDYQYVTRELSMYILSQDTQNPIVGRFDCLFYSQSLNKFMIVDWKTTEKIPSSSSFGKMLGPCFKLDDCKHNEYTIQTHFYKKALNETYSIADYNNIDCYICQMLQTPDNNGKNFFLHKENFAFDTKLLNKIIDHGFKKMQITQN